VEDDVKSPGDEAKAMQTTIKEKSQALRQKLGKLNAVTIPKLGDQLLAQVIIIHSYCSKRFLNEMFLKFHICS
jgi:hypothetical protein